MVPATGRFCGPHAQKAGLAPLRMKASGPTIILGPAAVT